LLIAQQIELKNKIIIPLFPNGDCVWKKVDDTEKLNGFSNDSSITSTSRDKLVHELKRGYEAIRVNPFFPCEDKIIT